VLHKNQHNADDDALWVRSRVAGTLQEENVRLREMTAELRRAKPSVAKLASLEVGLERTAAEDKERRALDLLRRKDATIRQLQAKLRGLAGAAAAATGAGQAADDEVCDVGAGMVCCAVHCARQRSCLVC
jgi:hypothetical protein